MWEETAKTGKIAAGDILKRKKSLPVVFALTHGSESDRRLIEAVYSQDEIAPADVARVVDLLNRCGARDYCRQVVREQGERALSALERVPDGPAVAEVRGLVDLVMA